MVRWKLELIYDSRYVHPKRSVVERYGDNENQDSEQQDR